MLTYITAFIFYTLAMVGILLVGFVIYKKTLTPNKMDTKGTIKVLDSCMIAPKKNLLIVKAGNEKFLIASDAERTTFLAKLSGESDNLSDAYSKEEAIQNILKEMNNSYEEKEFRKQFEEAENEKYINRENEEAKPQRQFMELYKDSKASNMQAARKISAKKEVIQKLLRELNDTKPQSRSRY